MIIVSLGVALQFAAVSRLGIGIMWERIARYQRPARRAIAVPVPIRPAYRSDARHRCRDYRLALRTARPPRGT